jgi:hypothetical protein
VRVTIGEKGLQSGMVELKQRSSDTGKISFDQILNVKSISTLLEDTLYE